MGMNLSIHIGPFVRVPVVSVIVRTREYGCSNPACTKRGGNLRDKFCSQCGQPHTERETEKPAQRLLTLDDLEGRFVDEVHAHHFNSQKGVWMPNHHGMGVRIDTDSDSEIVELNPDRATAECEIFRQRYARLLAAVKAQYGVELTVEYGAVSYYT
jgi:hypothetical protein